MAGLIDQARVFMSKPWQGCLLLICPLITNISSITYLEEKHSSEQNRFHLFQEVTVQVYIILFLI